MNVYRIYIYPYCWFIFHPFVDDWQKGGERFWVYICIFECLHILSLCILCFTKWGNDFECLNKKRGEGFWKKNFWFMRVYLLVYAYIYLFSFMHFIEYLIVYRYAWVKGELLWSLPLIHAYITPFVIIKKGEIVGPEAHHSSFDDD